MAGGAACCFVSVVVSHLPVWVSNDWPEGHEQSHVSSEIRILPPVHSSHSQTPFKHVVPSGQRPSAEHSCLHAPSPGACPLGQGFGTQRPSGPQTRPVGHVAQFSDSLQSTHVYTQAPSGEQPMPKGQASGEPGTQLIVGGLAPVGMMPSEPGSAPPGPGPDPSPDTTPGTP